MPLSTRDTEKPLVDVSVQLMAKRFTLTLIPAAVQFGFTWVPKRHESQLLKQRNAYDECTTRHTRLQAQIHCARVKLAR